MSLFRQRAFRQHPMLQWTWSSMFTGLPVGIAMFAAVQTAESTGLLKWDANDDPAKYAFVSAKLPHPDQAKIMEEAKRRGLPLYGPKGQKPGTY